MEYQEYIGKKFGDILEDLQKKEGRVKLGAAGKGSGFYWIDEAKKLTTDAALDLEHALYKGMKKKVRIAENAVRNLLESPPTLTDYARPFVNDATTEECGSWDGYVKATNEWFAELKHRKAIAVTRKDELDTRVPLLDKIVKDAFLATASWQKGDLSLLLEGIENGHRGDILEKEGKMLDTERFKEDEQPELE